ncbi:MAG TPA: FG-GAP-like repeat-containing protein [Verrucomicrobiae bacterium]|nr:FG-GAP-like repeat-containing protein [Verrucomicrobiae bacterium]
MSFADSRPTFDAPFRRLIVAALLAALPLACARSTEQAEGTRPPASPIAPPTPASAGPAGLQEGGAKPTRPLPKGEGTRRMAERLQALNAAAKPGVNPFLNAERAAQIKDTLPRMNDPLDRMLATTQMADELLRAGRIQEAIDTVTPLVNLPAGTPYAPPEVETREFLGLCWLRLGETANCIRDHTIESCLLPIQGGGVHRQKEGSRRALEEFARVLRQKPDDLGTRWLYNLAAMTLGEYPDRVPPEWRIPQSIFKSEADIGRFTDVAPKAGVDVRQHAGGAIMDDFDGDGLLDLMMSSMGLEDPLRFFHNNGDGTFEERTGAAGLKPLLGGLNIIHGDYDNDGDDDVVVLRGGWMQKGGRLPTSLLRNNGDGTFDDVTEEAGLLSFHPTQTGAFADYDGDGLLDLVIGREDMPDDPHPSELWRNNGDGTFSDRSKDLGADTRFGYVKGVVWGDYNNDGRPDLFVSVLSKPSHLFRNDGPLGAGAAANGANGWRFTDVTAEAKITRPADSFPTWWWDYDNDGWLDLLVAGFKFNGMPDLIAFELGQPTKTALPSLFHNNHDGTFTDVAHDVRIDRVALPMGSNHGDLDNDGWPDCYFGDGEPGFRSLIPNRMFRNDGGKRFQDITHSAGVGHIQKGHGVAMGDIDNDGDLDVFEEMGGWYQADQAHATLYRNPGHPANHWVTLRLEGSARPAAGAKATNRSAIGARIRVRVLTAAGTRDVYTSIGSGGSFGGNSLQAEIGLGPARSIEEIEVVWPTTGRTDTLKDVAMDRFYRLAEGTGHLEPITLKKIPL